MVNIRVLGQNHLVNVTEVSGLATQHVRKLHPRNSVGKLKSPLTTRFFFRSFLVLAEEDFNREQL